MFGSVAGRAVPAIGAAVVFSAGIAQRKQGLVESDRPVITPRHLARLMLTTPTGYRARTPSWSKLSSPSN
ncbi:hypothetical protein [Streptomyces sp. NBC_01483]|uniref:hypothetical protein n=1 Tax=Streptomyces sp. NBC_01483 TaxID=2903883 RepID=UPI002E32EF38|nr:hypothetical protein [Streptomyces sp. NBC_01483]